MFKSELEFEKQLVMTLLEKGWNDVLMNPTEKVLLDNWASILYSNNRDIDRLGNYPLIDSEMQQIIEQINKLKTPARLNDFINGKTISIRRENPLDKLHFGKEVSLKIFDRQVIAGGFSTYQIARQPVFKSKHNIYPDRRGDVMLLINGMPVIHVELKRSGVDVSQATNQIKKYYNENVFSGIFSLVQIFVAMTPEKTLYFSNPGEVSNFNLDYYFTWADVYNNPINSWKDIASQLLSIPMAHTLIGFYTIADNTDGQLKVMRSYQYYAAKRILSEVINKKWDEKDIYGGHIWHTTGSGKTLTSFKSAELISNSNAADKVVFLVDRIELGTQSLQQYRNFAGASNEVQATENTDVLITKLKSNNINDTLIVTSIQKMSNIKEEASINKEEIKIMNKKRIVFVVDEAHRSTFGIMLSIIKETFSKAIFFGFTGTPIHDENAKNLNTTLTIFGDELHRYSIADGIRDKNVLGFDPYLVSTFKDKDLREAVILNKTKSKTISEIFDDSEKVFTYNQVMKLPMASRKNSEGKVVKGVEDYIPMTQYQVDKHRKAVVSDVKDDWIKLSRNSKFHAIFATSSIKEAIRYYYLFKDIAPSIKVSALFDPSDQNNDNSIYKLDGIVNILEDYNKLFNQKFTISTYQLFKKDIALRLAHKEHYKSIENDKEKCLDIIIVVNQLLTGFDSKWLNTLYLDKVLVQENIVQSFSRTNRIFGYDKPFGIIKYYRKPFTMQQNIIEAFKTYSGDKVFGVFVDKLPDNLLKLNLVFRAIKDIFKSEGIDNFEKNPRNEESKKQFASKFNEFNKYLEAAKIQGFRWRKLKYKFKKPKKEITVEIDEKTYLIMVLRYKELFSRGASTISSNAPYPIETYLTEINTDQIDSEYMNSKFTKYVEELKNKDIKLIDKTLDDLHKTFASLTQEEQKYAELFLFNVQSNEIELIEGKTFKDYIIEYMERAKDNRVTRFCNFYGINLESFKNFINTFNPNKTNEFGKFDKLKETIDYDKAKESLENRYKDKFKKFDVVMRVDSDIVKFILDDDFEI